MLQLIVRIVILLPGLVSTRASVVAVGQFRWRADLEPKMIVRL